MPRKKTAYVESLRDAAKQTGIALPLLQAARASGCPAFKGSRVRLDVLREWISENPDVLTGDEAEGTVGLVALKQALLKQQIQRTLEQVRAARLANLEAEKRVVPMAQVTETIVALVAEFNQHTRRIEDDLPRTIQGLDLATARLRIREMFDKMRQTIHRGSLGIGVQS